MIRKVVVLFMFAILLLIINACSYNTQMVNSIITQLPDDVQPFQKKLFIQRPVGGETVSEFEKLFVGDFTIDIKEIRISINQSIAATGLFEITDENTCEYKLLPIIKQNHWDGGLTVTSNLDINYKLIRVDNDEIIWEKEIKTSQKKTFSDTALGAKRVQLLKEDTLKENSKQLIEELAQVSLPKE